MDASGVPLQIPKIPSDLPEASLVPVTKKA